jgi:hypothetical protein
MARRQFGLTRAAQTEEGTDDKVGSEVANRVSLSAGSRKPHFAHVLIE